MKDAERYPGGKLTVTAKVLRSLGHDIGESIVEGPEGLLNLLAGIFDPEGEYGYIPDLALLELKVREVEKTDLPDFDECNGYWINPSLNVIRTGWRGLTGFFREGEDVVPAPGECLVLMWKDRRGGIHIEEQRNDLILALKIAAENLDLRRLSEDTGRGVPSLRGLLYSAEESGILKRPTSRVRRNYDRIDSNIFPDNKFLAAETFTLQWHITQACDLHCKHCYDRSNREYLTFEKALYVLDQFYEFCIEKGVSGQVSFSGGNPFLHSSFFRIYEEAVKRGFVVAVLGNPVTEERLRELLSIRKPSFYQVSLEGLKDRNDWVRGEGHFERTLDFLSLLGRFGIYRMVMLTLTESNFRDVIPLAEQLRRLADTFTFNRLSMVGEGENLRLPPQGEFRIFLEEYLAACNDNVSLSLKDNFFNILRVGKGEPPIGGCTGYGCGAAFNFVSVLPDGEVHACRKFPSLIGNIYEDSLLEIYDSPIADRYREGPSECRDCSLRLVCRGCLAVAYSHKLDPFKDKDPYCFIQDPDR
jgi:selenobiotic family peptide radical SAM maturase